MNSIIFKFNKLITMNSEITRKSMKLNDVVVETETTG